MCSILLACSNLCSNPRQAQDLVSFAVIHTGRSITYATIELGCGRVTKKIEILTRYKQRIRKVRKVTFYFINFPFVTPYCKDKYVGNLKHC